MVDIRMASISLDTAVTPIIKRLLILGSNDFLRASQHNATSQQHQIDIEIERLKSVKKLLFLLRRTLDDIICNINEQYNDKRSTEGGVDDAQRKVAAAKITYQLNGIAVPIFNILQHQQQHNNSTGRICSNVNVIQRSANYACIEEAVLTLSVIWKLRTHIANNDNSSESMKASIKSLVLPSLVSCAISLSILQICNDGERDGTRNSANSSNDEKKTSDSSMMDAPQALDQGEDCAMAILGCIQSFFDNNGDTNVSNMNELDATVSLPQNNNDVLSTLAKEVGSAMGGAMVARLVQGCLSLLPQQNTHNGSSSSSNEGKMYRNDNKNLQLQALKTLQTLLIGIPIPKLWQSILPGCFAGLYRSAISQLRYTSASSSYKVASLSVEVLVLLLKQSLSCKKLSTIDQNGGKDGTVDIQSITASLMNAVHQSQSKHNEAAEAKNNDCDFPPELKAEVNNRLIGPISVLLSLLPTNNSKDARRSGLCLCQIIMIDTRSIWTETNIQTLERKALEYCLMMLGDDNINVSNSSRKVLHRYKSYLGTSVWKRQLSQHIVPAILELVEALPAFAKSRNEARHYLRLINGYFVISFRGMTDAFDTDECLTEKRKSDIGSAMSCSEAVDLVKKAFSVLFTPDIDAISCSPMVEIDPSSDPNKMTLYQEKDNSCRFLHIRDETVDVARTTARLYARVLGAKRCAFVIDACCSDMFEACSRMSRNSQMLIKDGLNRRLQWSGQCVLIAELLRGIRGEETSKRSKSTMNIFSSLASSVLPVIVSDPLWTLPTTSGAQQRASDTTAQPVTIINGNATLVSLLMGIIRQFINVLGGDNMKLHLPIILFPLLERASPICNHSSVQRAAFVTLWDISESIVCDNISSLLASNSDYLVDAISLRLTKCAREQAPMERSLAGVVDVILQSIVYRGDHSSDEKKNSPPGVGHVSMVTHLLNCLLTHVDRQSHTTAHTMNIQDIVRVFWSMITFMSSSIDNYIHINNSTDTKPEMGGTNDNDYWLQRLDIELNIESAVDDDTTDDIFQEVENEPIDEASSVVPNSDNQEETDFVQEIDSINCILTRCCYLLCHADLQIQVMCCGTILSGFQSLGKIGSFRKKTRGISANNPLLPAIGEFWPSIVAILRSASASLVSANTLTRSDLSIRHMMATDQHEQGPSQTSLQILITKLLSIISELCSSSDGFFVDRFENDVYPIIGKLLQNILPDNDSGMQAGAQKYSALMLPILHCFKSTFESSCRFGLVGLIPSAGTMLFPLLITSEGPISDGTMDALNAMLAVDCDALWRGLHTLSRRSFPCNPIDISSATVQMTGQMGNNGLVGSKSVRTVTEVSFTKRNRDCKTILSQKARELLDFIESLPEQEV